MINSDPNPPYDSPQALLQGVKDGRQKAKEQLYLLMYRVCFPKVKGYILKSGGRVEEAEDFFQEAMIVLFLAIESGAFDLATFSIRSSTDQMCAYIMAVAKNLWMKELRRRNRPPLPQEASEPGIETDVLSDVVTEKLNSMGKECKNLLALFFHQQKSPAIIAGALKKNTEDVKKQLAQCTDKLLESVGHLLDTNASAELAALVRKSMLDLEDRCQQLIGSFYFEKKSMEDIARAMGYSNAHSAAEQKNKCMRHLNRIVASHLIKL